MTTHRPPLRASAPQRQQGIALIMAIILLIIATLTGLAGMRNTSLQEKLSANLYDRAIAMQSAEFALSQAEQELFQTNSNTFPDTLIHTYQDPDGKFEFTFINCNSSNPAILAKIEENDESRKKCLALPGNTFDSNAANWNNATQDDTFNKDLKAGNPQYFIQYLGLKNSNANTNTSQSANQLQEGNTGVGNDALDVTQNATYRVTVRSSTPTADNDRAIVVLTSLVKSN